jgi:coenzyme F420-reducing hydrogenase alpha subunit
MYKHERVKKDYRQQMETYNNQIDEINQGKEYSKYSQDFKSKKVNEIKTKALKEQSYYKDQYLKAIEQDKKEIQNKILNNEMPQAVLDFAQTKPTKSEMKMLIDEYSNNYLAQKKLHEIARDNDMMIQTNYRPLDDQINKLERTKLNLGDVFSSEPLNDTLDKKLRQAMGL